MAMINPRENIPEAGESLVNVERCYIVGSPCVRLTFSSGKIVVAHIERIGDELPLCQRQESR